MALSNTTRRALMFAEVSLVSLDERLTFMLRDDVPAPPSEPLDDWRAAITLSNDRAVRR